MAKVLKDFPVRAGKNSRYPWDEWLNGRVWRLVYGTDFHVTSHSFLGSLSYRAKRSGIKVRTQHDGNDALIIQAILTK